MIARAESAGSDAGTMGGELPGRERLWLFPRQATGRLSANFAVDEFHCGCGDPRCHVTLVHPRLVEVLQTLRDRLARPLRLSSGYRCLAHNERVGGRARSFHTRGMAADVACGDEAVAELAEAAAEVPAIGGIGAYPARGFVHLDVRPRRLDGTPVRWSE